MSDPLDTIVIRGARWKSGLAFLGSIGFVLLGLWLVRHPDLAGSMRAMVGGWAAIVFFGAFAPLALASAIQSPRLILTPQGFTIERALRGRRSWAWSDIETPFLFEVRSTRIVSFSYRPGRQPSDILTNLGAGLGAPGSFGGHWNIEPEALLTLVQRYHVAATAS